MMFAMGCNDRVPKADPVQKPKIKINDSSLVSGRSNPLAPVDISPMDMAYLPVDFPVMKMSKKTSAAPVARVIYSRPHRQGRVIFGGLLKYGEPWRLGANEATEIEFFQNVTIQGKRVSKGRYVLYCIPQEKEWTIIFNNNLFTWGLTPDPAMDVIKFTLPVVQAPTTFEYFTIAFEDKPGKRTANLLLGWENVMSRLPIQY